jgi:heme oxygenase
MRVLGASTMSSDQVPPPPHTSLPLEINAATRTQHSALNRLIRSRLPLCLPPHIQTPQLYAWGLSVFGNIYTTFEEEWLRHLQLGETNTSRMVEILLKIHVPKLLRSRNFEREMATLKLCRNGDSSSEKSWDMLPAHQGAIRASIRTKPHTVLAYTWVMYMALFNGGRIIRDHLIEAGPEFWQVSKNPTNFGVAKDVGAHKARLNLALADRLQFWYFDSDSDGDDIKEDFKTRFDMAASQLTASERVDIVDEAVRIFEMLREMVDRLDENAKFGLYANQDSKVQPARQQSRWSQRTDTTGFTLLLAIRDFVWGILLSIYCYLFSGRTRSR